MIFLEFNDTNYHILQQLISQNKKIFLLVYSNSCGACKNVVPEWNKLGVLQSIKSNNIIIAKMQIKLSNNILKFFPRIQKQGNGIPKIMFINGTSSIIPFNDNTRDASSFIQWIYNILANIL